MYRYELVIYWSKEDQSFVVEKYQSYRAVSRKAIEDAHFANFLRPFKEVAGPAAR